MTKSEAIEKIKDICDSCAAENDCPFFDKENDNCIFWTHGIPIPSEWGDDK